MRVKNTAGMTYTVLLPYSQAAKALRKDEIAELPDGYRDCPQFEMLVKKGWMVEVCDKPKSEPAPAPVETKSGPEPKPEPEPLPEPEPEKPKSRRKRKKKLDSESIFSGEGDMEGKPLSDEVKADD